MNLTVKIHLASKAQEAESVWAISICKYANIYKIIVFFSRNNLLAPLNRGILILPLLRTCATVRLSSDLALWKRLGNWIASEQCPNQTSCQNKILPPVLITLPISNLINGTMNLMEDQKGERVPEKWSLYLNLMICFHKPWVPTYWYFHYHLASKARFIWDKFRSPNPPNSLFKHTTDHLIKIYFFLPPESTLDHRKVCLIWSILERHHLGIL